MEEEIINKIKKEYNKRKVAKERSLKIISRKQELENDPKVQEYLKLNNMIINSKCEQKIKQSNDEIIESIFNKYKYSIRETNNIYVYLGTFVVSNEYDIVHRPSDIRVSYDDPKAQFRIYINLENNIEEIIKINDCDKFEEENNIIFPITYNKRNYHYELQKEFSKDIIIDGQERACERDL